MSRVLVTGGVGQIGTAIVRRLLGDPAYEVRIADQHPAPHWMREGCEVHTGDLRLPERAHAATAGCTHVIHLAALTEHTADNRPYELIEANNALLSTAIRAAVEVQVERFTYISCAEVFAHATLFPTPEDHLAACPAPSSAYAFSKLAGELLCRAAHDEHGLPFTICRAADAYGPHEPPTGEIADLLRQALAGSGPLRLPGCERQTCTPTHMDDIATGVIAAMGSPAGLNEDFNIVAGEELSFAELARLAWDACGLDPETFALEGFASGSPADDPQAREPGDPARRWPSAQKARQVLGWEAQLDVREGIEATVTRLRDLGSIGSRA